MTNYIIVKFPVLCEAFSSVSLFPIWPGFNGAIYEPPFKDFDLLNMLFFLSPSFSLIDATHKDVDVLLLLSNSAYYVA